MSDEHLTDEKLAMLIADLEQGPTPPIIRVNSDKLLVMARELKAARQSDGTRSGMVNLTETVGSPDWTKFKSATDG